jgi:hypothetical protein
MASISSNPETTAVCQDFLVVDAVLRNRSPLCEFPARREKSREFFGFGLVWRKPVSELTVFQGVTAKFPKILSRELICCTREWRSAWLGRIAAKDRFLNRGI